MSTGYGAVGKTAGNMVGNVENEAKNLENQAKNMVGNFENELKAEEAKLKSSKTAPRTIVQVNKG